MDKNRIATVVMQNMAAWNEPDAAARETLLRRCWADGGVYVDPNVELSGAVALSRHIAEVQAAGPVRGSN